MAIIALNNRLVQWLARDTDSASDDVPPDRKEHVGLGALDEAGFERIDQSACCSSTSSSQAWKPTLARVFLSRLLELPIEALTEPLILIVEDNAGGKGRPTVFARLEWRGTWMTPTFNRSVAVEELLAQAQHKFGLGSPFGGTE